MKRYALVNRCTCEPDGWGCCCARPETVVESDTGTLMLVPIPPEVLAAMVSRPKVLRVFKCERHHISLVPQNQVDVEPPTRCPCQYGILHDITDRDGIVHASNRCDSPLTLLPDVLLEAASDE